MTTASPSALDHLLSEVPEPAQLRQNQIEGQGLKGLLGLLGLDLGSLGKLQIALKTARFLEALDGLELTGIMVDAEPLESESTLIHITWNRNTQDPALTVDGTLSEESELLSLWARQGLASNRASVNGEELEGGLRFSGGIESESGRSAWSLNSSRRAKRP